MDVTLAELAIELFFPADTAAAEAVRRVVNARPVGDQKPSRTARTK